jgi:thioredoxin reductase (NADPH)
MYCPSDPCPGEWPLIIIGAGPTGLATAIAARRLDIPALVLEKGCLVNSISRYPTNMVFFTTAELLEIGDVPMTSASAKPTRLEAMAYYRKVAMHERLHVHPYERVEKVERHAGGFRLHVRRHAGAAAIYTARRLVIAIGYYDLPNLLGVPGEELPHVRHYYQEAHPYAGCRVAVIGGKNSAVDAALDLYRHNAQVTLIVRKPQLSSSIKYWVRPDIENRLKAGEIAARFSTRIVSIGPRSLCLASESGEETLAADFVFALVGYHPDFDFLRSAGVEFDPETHRPRVNLKTFESNVPGLYLGGVVVAGRQTGEIFIENGRFHGQVIAEHIRQQL